MEKSEVISKLASSQGRRDEAPNVQLAEEIALGHHTEAVKVLVENLSAKKALRADCIKTLYEIGERKPEMISPYLEEFLKLLDSKDNRMQWGAMCAVSAVAGTIPDKVYPHLPRLMAAAESGSVITRDHAVKALALMGRQPKYRADAFHMLNEILLYAPVNQFPTYVEETAPLSDKETAERLKQTINNRLEEMNTQTKRKRLLKVLKRLE